MTKKDLREQFEKLAEKGQFDGFNFALNKGQKLVISDLNWLAKPLVSRKGNEYFALQSQDGFAVPLKTLCRMGSGITKESLLKALEDAFNKNKFGQITIVVEEVIDHKPYQLYTFSLKLGESIFLSKNNYSKKSALETIKFILMRLRRN